MTEKLHRLIVQASEDYNYAEIGVLSGFSDKKAARWAKRAVNSVEYSEYPDDEAAFRRLAEAIQSRDPEGKVPDSEEVRETLSDGRVVLEGTVGGSIPTREEILDRFGIDQDLFEITRERLVEKTTEMKLESFEVDSETGRLIKKQVPHQHRGYTYRFELKPREEAIIQIAALDNLLDRLESANWGWPTPVTRSTWPSDKDAHALVFNIQDLHLGKMAYDEGWSIGEAMSEHRRMLDRILSYVDASRLERIMYLFGGDFIQSDTPKGQTTAGTQVENTTRWENQFDAALDMMIDTVSFLGSIRPVEVHLVRGNHPWNTEYTICSAISRIFRSHDNVEVFPWKSGKAQIGFYDNFILGHHGDNAPPERAILSMANEFREEWGRSRFCEILSGHLHYRKGQEVLFEEHGKVVWRQCGSLSQTDPWHKAKSFEGGLRCAEAHLYHAHRGWVGTHNANAL